MTGIEKTDLFREALKGKNVPILTLDPKWYRLLDRVGNEDVKELEKKLNDLLKRQGKVHTETGEIKKIKKRLMEEMVPLADEARGGGEEAEKKLEENKRLIAECNEKLESYSDEELDLPVQIDEVNKELLLVTMEHCYETMQENTDEIEALEKWVADIRVELKKNLIRKQEKEVKNHEIYSYMHDIFGPGVVDLFDLKYDPESRFGGKNAGKKEEN
ncbi:MAG: hypothetical protein K6G57_07840 [Lachnospiraceae bacterium]|nr:hypothetical protein [Lachnospiraceae bacterium]